MIVRALDNVGDWTFGSGRNNYKSGIDAVAQNVQTRLSSFLGDCFFALSAGIDWFDLLGSKDQLALNLAVSATILNTDNVTGIVSLSTNLSVNRNITLRYVVDTNVGRITNSVAVSLTPGDRLITESGSFIVTEEGQNITTE